jgi:toxin HigB-1
MNYILGMIVGFSDPGSEDIYHGLDTKPARATLPKDLWPIAWRKLALLDSAVKLIDLKSPPGNRLELLKGSLSGRFSIRINDQFRIVFTFKEGNAAEVRILDYH